jgi:rhamnogalacturonyl hydrolase YesR
LWKLKTHPELPERFDCAGVKMQKLWDSSLFIAKLTFAQSQELVGKKQHYTNMVQQFVDNDCEACDSVGA